VPDFDSLVRFLVSGLAFGAVYAVSGTGLVILYRTTGVLNFAFGAIGAFGVHIAWSLGKAGPGLWGVKHLNRWVTYLVCVLFCVAVTYLYGRYVAPAFAQRDALTRALGTLGLLLILLGVMFWRWRTQDARTLELPVRTWRFAVGGARVNGTQVSAVAFGILVTVGVIAFLRSTALGTAMRAVANDRDISALLGVRVNRVESVAWIANGAICGVVALFLADMFRLDASGLTFFIIPAIAAALVGQLVHLWATFVAGFAIGIVEAELAGFDSKVITENRTMTPFIIAIGALLWYGRRRTIVLSGRAMQ
jgi:branched-chain amino acid transport system permease protein